MNESNNPVILVDLQDIKGGNWSKSLDEVKSFLKNLWDELDEEDPFIKKIKKANLDELKTLLEGCDYTIFHHIGELQEYINSENGVLVS
jgi:hypothetical protein